MYVAMHGKQPDDTDAVARWEVQVRKGALELAILASLWSERLYGLEILRRLADVSGLAVSYTHLTLPTILRV